MQQSSAVRPPATPRGGGLGAANPRTALKGPAAGGVGGSNSGGSGAKSLRALYLEGCADARVHPNSVLVSMLPDKAGVTIGDELDLSRNYIGDRGLGPVLLVLQKSQGLQRIILCDNGLRNNGVKMLCAVAASHPSLVSIDLSDNYISEGAAFALLHLAEENSRIQEIGLGNTRIAADHRIRIKDRLAQNALDA